MRLAVSGYAEECAKGRHGLVGVVVYVAGQLICRSRALGATHFAILASSQVWDSVRARNRGGKAALTRTALPVSQPISPTVPANPAMAALSGVWVVEERKKAFSP